jgi:hypothetical protein
MARLACLLLAFSPAVLSAAIVAHHAVEVPIWDDLERATLLQKWADGSLDWRYVYSPHIEHRMGVPRLITLLSASLGDGSLLTEQVVIFGIVVATALLVHVLLRQTFPGRSATVYGLSFLANVLLFSPLQWETFLFSIQTTFVMPPFALCLILAVLGSRLGHAAKFALCFVAALLASNSFSHGLALWGLVFAAVVLQRGFGPTRIRVAFLAAWLVVTTAVLVPHFTVDGYANTSDFSYVEKGERAPGLALSSLPARVPRALGFFGAIVGSPFARNTVLDPRAIAPYTALALLALFGLGVAHALGRRRYARLWDRQLPWLAMGGYAVVTCAAVAIGRSAVNKWSYGLVPHYLTVSTYLVLASVVLFGLLVEDVRRRARRPLLRAALPQAAALGAGALLAFQVLQWGIGVVGMREWRSARLQSRTAMLYINHFEPEYVRRLGETLEAPYKLVNRLDQTGYLEPALLPDTRLCHFAVDETPLDENDASLQMARFSRSTLAVRGYARLPEDGRRADGVLLTGLDETGQRIVVASLEMSGVPFVAIPEADHRLNAVVLPGLETFAPFRGRVPGHRLALLDTREIQAWAVDSQRMRVRPLPQHVAIIDTAAGPRAELRFGPGEMRSRDGLPQPGCGPDQARRHSWTRERAPDLAARAAEPVQSTARRIHG